MFRQKSADQPAETVALQALAHVVASDDLLSAFVQATGAGLDDLRAGAADPAFLGAVLDFVLAEDTRVLDLAAAIGAAPEAILRARAALPGGDAVHWT